VTAKVLFYVQHLLGVGHVMRAVALTEAMCRWQLRVCLVHGGAPVPHADFGRAQVVQLPVLKARDSSFSGLVDSVGKAPDQHFLGARRRQLLSCLQRFAPDLVLIEAFPFGRRQMHFELLPLLDACRSANPRPVLVCSVRDIVQRRRKPGRTQESVRLINEFFDHVLVHGDAKFITFDESFAGTAEIATRIHYTGYVVRMPGDSVADANAQVLVSAGGGAVGFQLLRTALQARVLSQAAELKWWLLVGEGVSPKALDSLREMAPSGVTLTRTRPDFQSLLSRCLLSISQAGYNTVAEVLRAGAPAVLVPFEGTGETEQIQRAERLAQRGLVQVVRERQLSPEHLAAAVDRALAGRPDPKSRPDLSGASSSAALIANWATQ